MTPRFPSQGALLVAALTALILMGGLVLMLWIGRRGKRNPPPS